MAETIERAALVALLRSGKRSWQDYADMVEEAGGALQILDDELGLLAREDLDSIAAEIEEWEQQGISLQTVLDQKYPENLRGVHDRPPVVFIAGALEPQDNRSVAVVGTRQPTSHGVEAARSIARHLVRNDHTVVSGLAAGIDTAAHTAALTAGGRTVAVIGTGLKHAYPAQNAELQRTIAAEFAVVSQFWPDAPPTQKTFPMRNAVMSGLALATVVVEASQTSGARVQTRLALTHGRPVFLARELLQQRWARELARTPGTHVFDQPQEITDAVERLTSTDSLTA